MVSQLRNWACIGMMLALATTCSRAGEADALAISANIQARHLPFGVIMDPVFAAPDSYQISGYSRCGDAAIWTGHYLAAEAFRYKVTRSDEALDNVRKAIAGIKGLADVTGTNLLARCLLPADSPFADGIRNEEAHNGIYSAPPWIWVGNTSRDQYSGVMFGLAVAYDMVDDAGVRNSVSQLVTRLVDFLRGHNWTIVMPDGKVSTAFLGRGDQMLSFLQVARHVNPDHFSTVYDLNRILLSAELLAPIGVDVLSDESYFKFNLDSINLYNLVRLESSSARAIYEKAYDILRNHTAGHQNAFFNMIDRALNSANAARDAETVALLDAWLRRPKRDEIIDLHGAVAVCGDQACQPVPVPMRPTTDFLWQRNPFDLVGWGLSRTENAGIDYILPYWMARYYAVGAAFSVRSAAAEIFVTTPDSLASLIGSNLAATTETAALPWPTSLGGASVKVRDAANVERTALLSYAAPGQVNFVVPPDTAPGLATFTITRGSATISATGTVQMVSPTLFSMNAQGTGVAAATAFRTLAGNAQFQSPVDVFQCDSNGANCVPAPIELGIDTPVYLTLYGTGVRNRSALDNVTVTINGMSVPVLYAGAQPQYPGFDQIDVALTLQLRGAGECDVVVTVDGQSSNAVRMNIR